MNIEENNTRHRLLVVRIALEDLVAVRLAHGANSPAYARQQERSMGFIRGNLEEVLTAAQAHLSAMHAHGGCRPPTGTD